MAWNNGGGLKCLYLCRFIEYIPDRGGGQGVGRRRKEGMRERNREERKGIRRGEIRGKEKVSEEKKKVKGMEGKVWKGTASE